jgi:hypothetical protein
VRATPARRAKDHPDRAKRIDSATSDAAEGAPKIARAKCPTNPAGSKKSVSEGPRVASHRRRTRPKRNGGICAHRLDLESNLARAPVEMLGRFINFK